MEARLLSTKEAAIYLNLHPQTIYTMAIGGELPSLKIGKSRKFDKVSLDEWIKNKQEERHD